MKLTYKDPAKNNWFLVSWTLSNSVIIDVNTVQTYYIMEVQDNLNGQL